MLKNTAGQGVYVFAYDIVAEAAKTGDSGNITANISKDGAAVGAVVDTNPTEIGGGAYWFNLSQEETNAVSISIIASSTTANVELEPVFVSTTISTDIISILGVTSAASNLKTTYETNTVPSYVLETTSIGAAGYNQVSITPSASQLGINDSYNGNIVSVTDITDSHTESKVITDYTVSGTDALITADSNFAFLPTTGDLVKISRNYTDQSILRSTTSGRTINVSLAGRADTDVKLFSGSSAKTTVLGASNETHRSIIASVSAITTAGSVPGLR